MANIKIQEAFTRLIGKVRRNTVAINNRAIKDLSNVENGLANVGKFLTVPAGGTGVEYSAGTISPWAMQNYTMGSNVDTNLAFQSAQSNYLKGGICLYYDTTGRVYTVISFWGQSPITALVATADYNTGFYDQRTGSGVLRIITSQDTFGASARLQVFIPNGNGSSGGTNTGTETMDDSEISDMEEEVLA